MACFLFFPHAVRVLSAVYLGWLAFPGLFLGHLLSWYVIFDDITLLQILAITVSACGCNLAVMLLQSSYIGPKATNLRSFNESLYRHVFLGGPCRLSNYFYREWNIFTLTGGWQLARPNDDVEVHCW